MARGKTLRSIVERPDGHAIEVINRPIRGGDYWVGTHDNITERRLTEMRIASLAEQEAHRASVDTEIRAFRASVEAVLRSMSDSASEMGRTAAGLSASSRETAQRASGAVRTSNDAAVNVKAASDAARELAPAQRRLQPVEVPALHAQQLVDEQAGTLAGQAEQQDGSRQSTLVVV